MGVSTTQTGTTYTVDADDNTTIVRFSNASGCTVTLPTDAANDLDDGYQVVLYAEGAGGLTLTTTGLTLTDTDVPSSVAQYGMFFCEKTADANTWIVTVSGPGGFVAQTGTPTREDVLWLDTDATPSNTIGDPQTVTDTTDTLADADRFRLTMYSNASAVTVTVPTGTFSAGDWFLLQSTGAGGLSLSTTGITLNGSSPSTGVAQNEGLLIVFTAANTISVFGGTA